MHFLQVMDNTEEVPLGIHLLFASQAEPIQSHDRSDMGKGWFTNGQPHSVDGSADRGIDLPLHLFGKSFLSYP